MPCSDASVQVSYAENMNAYQYTWFVGQEWGTWGTTAAFETKEWSGAGSYWLSESNKDYQWQAV